MEEDWQQKALAAVQRIVTILERIAIRTLRLSEIYMHTPDRNLSAIKVLELDIYIRDILLMSPIYSLDSQSFHWLGILTCLMEYTDVHAILCISVGPSIKDYALEVNWLKECISLDLLRVRELVPFRHDGKTLPLSTERIASITRIIPPSHRTIK